jgi:hypothetical protein
MTTLLAIVVGVHPHMMSPRSSPGSMNVLEVAHAETRPKIMDDVSR